MHQDQPIPFNRAAIEGNELAYIQQALERGHTSSGGEFVKRAEEILLAEFSAPGRAADDLVHVGSRADCPDAGSPAGRHGDRAVVHVHDDGARVRPAGREDQVLRHRAGDVGPRHRAPQVAARRDGARGRAGALRGRRVRHRRDAQGARRLAGRRGDRGQRARTLRPVERAAARHLGRFATQSFHDTKNIVCGEGGALVVNDPARRRPGPRALREGHQPPGVLPRPGRQVLVEGHRVVVRAGQRAGGIPHGAAREGAT